MTIDLPPRRALPDHVKERMRPTFTEVTTRRRHLPYAAAAGVASLIAAAAFLSHPAPDDAQPTGRVTAPSRQDVERCRTALNDRAWQAPGMVAFNVHKVLVGADGRFCELTRSYARVTQPDKPPLRLDAGTLAYRSEYIVAGKPPPGSVAAARARSRQGQTSRGSADAVVTPDFYVIYSPAKLDVTELVFDDRAVPVPVNPAEALPYAQSDSYESGDGTQRTAVNLLARCLDNALTDASEAATRQGWQPLANIGVGEDDGMIVAQRADAEWGTCRFSPLGTASFFPRPEIPRDPEKMVLVGGVTSPNGFIFAARTVRAGKTAELTYAGVHVATVDVVDGFLLARLPVATGEPNPTKFGVTVFTADNSVVYQGGLW